MNQPISPTPAQHSPPLHLYAEHGRLRRAVVHPPGQELQNITPRHIGRVYMDDVLYLAEAQADHRELCAVLEHAGVELWHFAALLRDSLQQLDSVQRRQFVEALAALEGLDSALQEELALLEPEALAQVCIEGLLPPASITQFIAHDAYRLAPLPNALFVRDPVLIMRDFYLLGQMRHPIRAREGLLWAWITQQHPLFSANAQPALTTALQAALGAAGAALEGGNLLLLSPDTLLLGCNERSSPAALDLLAAHLLHSDSGIRRLIVGIFSAEKPYFSHYLDTGFCLLQHQPGSSLEILLHAPMLAPEGANITWLLMQPGESGTVASRPLHSLSAALRTVPLLADSPPDFSFCGSQHRRGVRARILQEREWHYQACNALPLAPGKLIMFRRNIHSIAALAAKGYQVMSAADFLQLPSGTVEAQLADPNARLLITVRDQEISRTHGGPRSLVLPLHRDHPIP